MGETLGQAWKAQCCQHDGCGGIQPALQGMAEKGSSKLSNDRCQCTWTAGAWQALQCCVGQMAGRPVAEPDVVWMTTGRFCRWLVQHRNMQADHSLTMCWRVDSRRASCRILAGQQPDAKRTAAAAACPGRYCSSPSNCCDTGIRCCGPHLSLKEVRSDFGDVLRTGLGVLSIVHVNVQPCVGA